MLKNWTHGQNKHQAVWLCSRLDASGQGVYPKLSWMSVIKRHYAKTNGNLGLDTQLHLACCMHYKALGDWRCPEILLLCWESRQHLCRISSVHDKRAGGYNLQCLLTTNRKWSFFRFSNTKQCLDLFFCHSNILTLYLYFLQKSSKKHQKTKTYIIFLPVWRPQCKMEKLHRTLDASLQTLLFNTKAQVKVRCEKKVPFSTSTNNTSA